MMPTLILFRNKLGKGLVIGDFMSMGQRVNASHLLADGLRHASLKRKSEAIIGMAFYLYLSFYLKSVR